MKQFKQFKVSVLTMRSYILKDRLIIAETSTEVRAIVWSFLAKNGYLDRELFYKLEVREI